MMSGNRDSNGATASGRSGCRPYATPPGHTPEPPPTGWPPEGTTNALVVVEVALPGPVALGCVLKLLMLTMMGCGRGCCCWAVALVRGADGGGALELPLPAPPPPSSPPLSPPLPFPLAVVCDTETLKPG